MKRFVFLIFFAVFVSCRNTPAIQPISYDEMVMLIEQNQLQISQDITYYSANGDLLTKEERLELNDALRFADYYVLDDTLLIKVVLKEVEKVRYQVKQSPLLKNGASDIDCSNLVTLLERIYFRDQEDRKDNLKDDGIDAYNVQVVDWIIEKCGMPTPDTAGPNGLDTMWLVIQHATLEKRLEYFPLFLQASKAGHLERQNIALMQDRILMDQGKEQLYGSQVLLQSDGSYVLYDLREPQKVDHRRAIMGLPPLEEYLNYFNIKFDVPQQ